MKSKTPRFLPYQARWLNDISRIKVWEKSRRIGATWTQSYEDVSDCIAKPGLQVWFSSADLTAAMEYIDYAEDWAKLHQRVSVKVLGEQVIDEKKGVKALVLEFSNGSRIHALSSNPKAFRSKGGKVVWDEAGWHDDADAMWKAIRPCIMWGYTLRILSTHNGTSSKFYRFVQDIKAKRLRWSLHTTPITLAVEEGLADKILGHRLTAAERDQWLKDEHDDCGDEDAWQQEYCCQATDTNSSFLTYDEISACEDPNSLIPDLSVVAGDLTVGFDVARVIDLSVIATLESYGGIAWTRQMIEMSNTKFGIQRETLWNTLRHPKLRRGCIDRTGIGMQMSEETQEEFGKYRIEPMTFTPGVKEDLAYGLRRKIEDRAIRIPPDFKLREDLHSIKKIVTASGAIRFDAARSENGHADRFWALAMAIHAISPDSGPIRGASSSGAHVSRIATGYDAAPKSRLTRDLRPRKIWDGY